VSVARGQFNGQYSDVVVADAMFWFTERETRGQQPKPSKQYNDLSLHSDTL
jgi:hypothetical protein